ncbi:hypothetical protein [Rhodobium gokarnense]|uniref:Uncharacterized protein n=1 Tax=Rhodobium gokarnense TaxID=364296 RepID=A0ABT3HHW4_9HYPH|nr:hypothetical protein [Rhodobium gokarnense]MCW2309993.1 hypothetical protein [Rhodobium gokarnense]
MIRSAVFLSAALLATMPCALAAQEKTVPTERIVIDELSKEQPAGDSAAPVPSPDAVTPDATPEAGVEGDADATSEDPKQAAPLPEVRYGTAELPEPVQRMREALIEAAKSGNVEELRTVFEMNELMPTLSFGDITDPIEHLKKASGDGEGREVMAILLEVLEAGWVHVDAGKPSEMYVWPYFAQYPLADLTPPQLVELFRIVTSYDYQEMQTYGTYIFYRVGIGPDGTLHYFVAGD